MFMPATLSLLVIQLLDQWAAVAGGAVKLDSGMGDMKVVLQFVLDSMQQPAALSIIGRVYFDMSRQG